jgi:hypothetical protein
MEEIMTRAVDFNVTCLRVSELSIDRETIAESMQKRWQLDRLPKISIELARSGKETSAHITRVHAKMTSDFAATLDSPWGIDAFAESISALLRQMLRVHTVVFDHTVR